jgi:peptidyl-prolyl cis-trans isomerase D
MSIQKIRDRSEGIVAKILVGLIIIVFALFGFGSITTFLAPVPKVATVAGESVTQQEMELAVERGRRILLSRNPSATIDEDALRKDVLQNLITRKLLSVAADDLGLHYSDASLDQEIVQTEVFQIDGVFSPAQFQLVLGSAGYTPLSYRDEMRIDKELQQLAAGIQGSSFMTPDQAGHASALAQQTRDVAFLRIDVDELVKDIDVTADEVRNYYRDHPAEFMTEELVDIEYLELERKDLIDQVPVDEPTLAAYFEENRSVYAKPENRRLAHILIEVNDESSDAVAAAKIEAIYERIVAGENFSDVAKEMSDDGGSAVQGGDLGFNPPNTFVPEFEDAASKLTLNQMTKPVKTEFGYHIIKLLGLEEAHMPELAEVRERVEKDYRELQAEHEFVKKSAELSELAFESADLLAPSDELRLPIKHTGLVSRKVSEGLGANASVMEAAFAADVLADGNNSKLIEITPNDHVVIRVKEHRPPELMSFEQVEADVRETLARTKATELATSRAKEIVAMLESGSIARFVADSFGLRWEVLSQIGRNQDWTVRSIRRPSSCPVRWKGESQWDSPCWRTVTPRLSA